MTSVYDRVRHREAEAVLRRSYGLGRRLYERVVGERSPSTYLEVTPDVP